MLTFLPVLNSNASKCHTAIAYVNRHLKIPKYGIDTFNVLRLPLALELQQFAWWAVEDGS